MVVAKTPAAGATDAREKNVMTQPQVLSERRGSVLLLTLNRPERRNAWTYQMGDLYFDYLDDADDDGEVRAIVVTGNGQGFCPGMDGAALSTSANTRKRPEPSKGRAMTHARTVRKPISAAINGACAGFGLVQAMHCDVRFAARSAVFSTAFARRGLGAKVRKQSVRARK